MATEIRSFVPGGRLPSSAALYGKIAPALALILLLGSIGVGLAFVLVTGFGYLPAMGGDAWSLDRFRDLSADPRLVPSLITTVTAGLAATMASFLVALSLVAQLDPVGENGHGLAHRLAVAILAVPHIAMALGLAFLLMPSGWIMRAVAAVTGLFGVPPDWQLVPESEGLTLALGLFLKETPFLFIAMVMALAQIKPAPILLMARTLGYRDHIAWVKLVLPRLYPLIRFPVLAVLAYGLSVVDMALILGPRTPATLPVLILRWANDPDIDQRFLAAAAALLQLLLVAAAILLWWLGECVIGHILRHWRTNGARDWPKGLAAAGLLVLRGVCVLAVAAITLSLLALLIWSVAAAWRYPDILPNAFSTAAWQRAAQVLWQPLGNSLLLAGVGTMAAVALALACLEHERHLRWHIVKRAERWLFLPLLVPEVSFLLGLQVLLLLVGLNGGWFAVAWLHLLFVFPYVFLTLKEPWRAFDSRYERVALALGASPWRVLWRVKLPMLRGAIAWAAAIGCTVSLSLYLPTILAGEGRITTLATETIALSAGGDRRIVGVYGALQAIVSGLIFLLALLTLRRRRWAAA